MEETEHDPEQKPLVRPVTNKPVVTMNKILCGAKRTLQPSTNQAFLIQWQVTQVINYKNDAL